MMREIPRYVFGKLVVVALVVTVALALAVWLTGSLRPIDLIVNRGLSVDTFPWLVILLPPMFLGVALPIVTFCALLFIYNKLTMDREMIVTRAGLATGFPIHAASNFVFAPGLLAKIPATLAGWAPAAVSALPGGTILFHMEDG